MHLLSRLRNSSVSFIRSKLAFTCSLTSVPPHLVSLGGSTLVRRLHWTPMDLLAFFSPGLSTILWGFPEPQVKSCFGFCCFLFLPSSWCPYLSFLLLFGPSSSCRGGLFMLSITSPPGPFDTLLSIFVGWGLMWVALKISGGWIGCLACLSSFAGFWGPSNVTDDMEILVTLSPDRADTVVIHETT